ncbi:UNVERIFIED_ORG: multidrug resistance efflux pump [Rhizobium etli]
MADQSNFRVVADADAKTSEENQIKQQETVAEAPSSSSAPAAAVAAPGGNKVRRRRSLTRPILFALLPAALVAGGYYYVNGGQVMSTDNAYIQADMVGVTTDVSGIVNEINVRENEAVKAGQVLFSLRADSFKIALDGAKAQLGVQRNQIMNLKASYQQSLAEITQAQADLPYYQEQFDRQQNLVNNGSATQSAYDEAKHNLEAAQQKVTVAKAEAATTLAQLGGSADQPIEENPLYLQAKSNVDNAQRELDHSVVKAPFDGIVTNVNALQVGSYLQASAAGLLACRDRPSVDRRQPEGNRADLRQTRPDGGDLRRHLSRRDVEGQGREHQPGLRLQLRAAAGPEHHRQLGEGRPAHSDARQHRGYARQAAASRRHEHGRRRRNRSCPRPARLRQQASGPVSGQG